MDKQIKLVLKNAHEYKYYIITILTITLLFITGYIYYNCISIKYKLKDKFLIEDNLPSFRYEAGTFDTWTVPPGATQATFTVVGGSGSSVPNTSYGNGANVTATLSVIPGTIYNIWVGTNATTIYDGNNESYNITNNINGICGNGTIGYNGGNGETGYLPNIGGGSGGGASVVFINNTSTPTPTPTPSNIIPIIVAGGGGGSGGGGRGLNGSWGGSSDPKGGSSGNNVNGDGDYGSVYDSWLLSSGGDSGGSGTPTIVNGVYINTNGSNSIGGGGGGGGINGGVGGGVDASLIVLKLSDWMYSQRAEDPEPKILDSRGGGGGGGSYVNKTLSLSSIISSSITQVGDIIPYIKISWTYQLPTTSAPPTTTTTAPPATTTQPATTTTTTPATTTTTQSPTTTNQSPTTTLYNMLPTTTKYINSNQSDINISGNLDNLNGVMSNNLVVGSNLYISPMFNHSLYSPSQNQGYPRNTNTNTNMYKTNIDSTFVPSVELK